MLGEYSMCSQFPYIRASSRTVRAWSISGVCFFLQGFKNGAVYAASKHAALGMVRSAAKEMGARARVNCILP